MMTDFPHIATPRLSSGRIGDGGQAGLISLVGMRGFVRRTWSDLPPTAEIALIPLEDLEIIIAATRGVYVPPVRSFVSFTVTLVDPVPQVTVGRWLWCRLIEMFAQW